MELWKKLLIIVAIGIICFSGYMVLNTVMEYKEAEDEYDLLSQYVSESGGEYVFDGVNLQEISQDSSDEPDHSLMNGIVVSDNLEDTEEDDKDLGNAQDKLTDGESDSDSGDSDAESGDSDGGSSEGTATSDGDTDDLDAEQKELEEHDNAKLVKSVVTTSKVIKGMSDESMITPDMIERKELRTNKNRSDFPNINVDFDGLRKINPDLVAWLYVGGAKINYPVVQGEDNEYYLHQTFEDKKNSSGCIFMDWEVNTDLSSWNTFFYGHNMKNGAMFGSLKNYIWNDSIYKKDKYIYVFVPEGIYRYEIFSYYLDSPDSVMYYTCDNLKEWRQYLRDAKDKSKYKCSADTNADDNIVTLVTCSGSGSSKQRFFVHGTFVDRYVYSESELNAMKQLHSVTTSEK